MEPHAVPSRLDCRSSLLCPRSRAKAEESLPASVKRRPELYDVESLVPRQQASVRHHHAVRRSCRPLNGKSGCLSLRFASRSHAMCAKQELSVRRLNSAHGETANATQTEARRCAPRAESRGISASLPPGKHNRRRRNNSFQRPDDGPEPPIPRSRVERLVGEASDQRTTGNLGPNTARHEHPIEGSSDCRGHDCAPLLWQKDRTRRELRGFRFAANQCQVHATEQLTSCAMGNQASGMVRATASLSMR